LKTVNDAKFKALLDAYGAEIERWPSAERAEARRRLAEAGRAERDMFKQAAALDALLKVRREATEAKVPADLVGRIMQSYDPPPQARGFAGGGAIAIADLLGFRARMAAASVLLIAAGMFAGWSASYDIASSDALISAVYGDEPDTLFSVEDL
jgi:hypothetical protein